METIFSIWTLLLLCALTFEVSTLPLEPLPGKSGEDQVKEAVHKAEVAARQAAEKDGNTAELRVAAIKAKLAAQHALKQQLHKVRHLHPKVRPLRKWGHLRHLQNKLKSYQDENFDTMQHTHFRRPRHRNSYSNMISLNELASDAPSQNNYNEDTTLEDRLALEAEEDKKYGAVSDNNEYDTSRSSLGNQDATQSIQNQVASESARELKEIQQQINAESQNSLGKTTIGQPAALFQGHPPQQRQSQQNPTARNGMMGVQSDLNNALNNAEEMNDDSNIASPQINGNAENNMGGNAFTGFGEEKQMDDNGAMNTQGLSSMVNQEPQQSEAMGGDQASMEGQQETAQAATSALAAGAGAAFSNPQPEMSNDIGGLGGPAGPAENNVPEEPQGMPAFNSDGLGDNKLGGEGMLPGGNIDSTPFAGNSMKKSRINDSKPHPRRN